MNMESTPGLLARLHERGIIDDECRAELARHTPTPWWLAIVLALAAWVASLIILASFFGPLLALGDSDVSRGFGGAVLIAAALFLFRRHHPFAAQMALAFSLAGQALLVMAVAGGFDAPLRSANFIALTGATIAAAMMLARSSGLHRSVCAVIVLGNLAWLIGPGSGLALFGVALAAASVALWLTRARWAAHPHAPAVKAAAHATTLAALLLAPYGNAHTAVEVLGRLLGATHAQAVPMIYGGGLALVFLATVAWLTRAAATIVRVAALAAAALFVAVAYPAPGLIASAAVLLAVFHACHRPWIALTLLFAVLYLGEFYYSLHITLLTKSLILAATGALLLALRTGLKSFEGSAS